MDENMKNFNNWNLSLKTMVQYLKLRTAWNQQNFGKEEEIGLVNLKRPQSERPKKSVRDTRKADICSTAAPVER
jgi:hypothetical protein